MTNTLPPGWPTGPYEVIYADPPWSYRNKYLQRGGAERHYPTMRLKEICALPVADICTDNSVLFLWATMPFLPQALEVVKAWGFTYKTVAFTWVKLNKKSDSLFWGCGHYTRSNAELCLLGLRGKPERRSAAVHSVIMSRVGRHSEKPAEARIRIEKLFGSCRRLEMFARTTAPGWDSWGLELLDGQC